MSGHGGTGGRFVSDFISCRPEDPEPSCSCILRTQNRYRTAVGGEEVQAVSCAEWGSSIIFHIGSMSLPLLPSVKLFRNPQKSVRRMPCAISFALQIVLG